MMARSKCSNLRPDTLMQDRLPPARQNPLATHGRTIHLGQTGDILARQAHVCFTPDSVAKLGRFRLQSLVVSLNRPLVCALPCVGFGVYSWASTRGKQLPAVAGRGREAWRAASG